ncbi:DoxX family protein [Sphingomonas naphthae]|uniref:DoxX family protein n=1 Tax=Sphingomonas naphthae TaxID=1813468 RepID=A0ABY7TJZ8_9SPHN|nr:DoxX family protein [Sphingomonas naphthae]WCT73363.1 DoxX family protein [Sphingomonas naphthae]
MATLAFDPALAPARDRRLLAGRILGGVGIAFLLLDGAMKLAPLQPVIDTMQALGWPTGSGLLRTLGVIQIGATLLYAWRRTSLIGAILLTAYLGGAIATHVRIGSPLATHCFFGIYVALLLWGALWLRDPRLRALVSNR